MTVQDTATQLLWITPILIHLVMVWRMSQFKNLKTFPLFVFYCCLQVVRFLVLYPMYVHFSHYRVAYFFGYWAFEAFDVCVSLVIIREIYLDLFAPYAAIRRLGGALFNWAAAILILVCVYVALLIQVPKTVPLIRYVVAFDQSSTILRAGLILLVICLGMFFRIHWPRYSFAIAIGFFVFLLLNFGGLVLMMANGPAAAKQYALIKAAGYNVGAFLWAWHFAREYAKEPNAAGMSSFDLARWNAELAEILR